MLFFVVALLVVLACCIRSCALFGHALALPAHVRACRARRRRERAHAALAAALQAYYEGRYARAEKEAAIRIRGRAVARRGRAARGARAHQMRDFERRDRWLERADALGDSLQPRAS